MWLIKFNVDKCEILSIGYNNPQICYRLDNVTILIKVTNRDHGINVLNDFFSNIVIDCFVLRTFAEDSLNYGKTR